MQKTSNYSLKKPEVTDPLRVEDFNENADKIDTTLAVLDTAITNAGNCKITMGSYVGNGTYGVDNPTTLTFEFEPKMVVIWKDSYTSASCGSVTERVGFWGLSFAILLPHVQRMSVSLGSADKTLSFLTFTGRSVSVYNYENANLQWNGSNTPYYYLALG